MSGFSLAATKALVDYESEDSNSGSGSEPELVPKANKNNHRGTPPPLPPAFHDLYASTVRTTSADHPSLHNGRQRAIPHVAGQWPSHLYIDWNPSSQEYERLNELMTALRGNLDDSTALHSLLTSDLGVPLPLHISLSRPFVLQTAEKADFLQQLTASIKSAGMNAFEVVFSDLFWFRGPDSTRAFLVLRAEVESDAENRLLVSLLEKCNAQVTEAGQPALYSSDKSSTARSFHVSIAWTLADIEPWRAPTDQTHEKWQKDLKTSRSVLRIDVKSIKAKIGNVVTDIPLDKAAVSNGVRPGKRARSESGETTNGSRNEKNKRSERGERANNSNDTRRKGKSLFGL